MIYAAAAAAAEAPGTEFGYADGGSAFDSMASVMADPVTWAFMAIAGLMAALASVLLRKFVLRIGSLALIVLAGTSPLMIVAGLIFYAGLFGRESGFDGLLDILLETQMSFALSLLFVAGLLGARVTIALLNRRNRKSGAETFE